MIKITPRIAQMRITKITASHRIQDLIDFIKSKDFNIADIVNKVDEEDPMMDLIGDSFRREVVRQAIKFLIERGYSKYDTNSPEVRHLLEHMARGHGEVY